MSEFERNRRQHTNSSSSERNSRQEGQRAYNLPHEQLVKAIRGYIAEKDQTYEGEFSPVEIIRLRLSMDESRSLNLIDRSPPLEELERDFFWQLRTAWDIVAYDHYPPGSRLEQAAGRKLWYDVSRGVKPTITPSHPLQVRTLDALTEAVGIPHRKGITVYQVPDKLRDYVRYTFSPEYKDRVAKEQEKSRRRS